MTDRNTSKGLGVVTAVLLATASLSAVLPASDGNEFAIAYPKEERGYGHDYGMMKGDSKPGHYASGTVASIQNDETGNPTWLVSGQWKGFISSMTEDGVATGANASKSAEFNTVFDMVMKNGSAHHQHKIYNFTFTNMSMPGVSADMSMPGVQIDGTITVTMRDGPVHDVPVTITLQGDVVSISLDPNMTNNHFGDTPIYGVIDKLVHIIK
ncbi:MAG TPA: hypothetical protein VE130_15050 [Nitrososphaeraceae archaeon]|nr:hypothetical protein [Nitrososphaeraceae archaeon]